MAAEHEMVCIVDAIMQSVGAKRSYYQIKLNSRKFMDYVLNDYLLLDEVECATVRRLIDKMHKMDPAEFAADIEAAISPSARESGAATKLLEALQATTTADLPETLSSHESLAEIKELMLLLNDSGITNAVFDITLMRGFDYYTDIVFEVIDTDPENNRSMFGGGRYDGLVGLFGVEPVPTVGFAMGDITFMNFLEAHDLVPQLTSETELYVVLVGDVYRQAQTLLAELRSEGVNTAVDTSGRKLDKQIKTAEKKGLTNVLFVGQDELTSEQYKLKNLQSSEEQTLSLARVISVVKDIRKK